VVAASFDAFVSYARVDREFVDGRLVPALAGRGKKAWVDRENLPAGAEFPPRIEAGIRQSAAFLFVLSPESAASDWCRRELEEAVRQHKRLVPIVAREVADAAVPRALQDVTWVRWLTADDAQATGQVLDALEETVEWRERQAEIATRAHDWRLRGDRGSLLRGRALKDAEAWLTEASLHGRSPTPEQAEYIDRSRQAQTRWRRLGMGALLGVVAVTSILAVVAWRERGRALDNERAAEEQTRIAQSRELAANARARLGDDDPQLALILGLVAVETSATDAAEETLRSSLAAVRGWGDPDTIRLDGPVVALGAAGGHAVTRGADGRLAAWRLDEPTRPVLTTPAGDPLFSADDRLLAVRTDTGSLGAWRLTGDALGELSAVAAADFDRDGRLLVAVPDGLVDWDPSTGEQRPRALGLREGVRSVIAVDRTFYATVDDRRVSLWNPLAPGNGTKGPISEHEEPHGIDRSWPSRSRRSVVTTNARGSAVISTITSTLDSRIPLGSLRAVAFSRGGELMVVAPSAGPPALVRVETGEIVSRLPRNAAGATAVAFAGESILVAAGGVVRRYACAQCASLGTVVDDARRRVKRPLTRAERELFLRERRATPCPLNDVEADPCLELFPDSGPPGTVVEVSGLRAGGELSLVDATGASWELEPLDAPTVSGLAATRLGTVTIPEDVPRGPVRIVSGSAAERAFRVTCAWCYEPRP
jgi:hypothetical protein